MCKHSNDAAAPAHVAHPSHGCCRSCTPFLAQVKQLGHCLPGGMATRAEASSCTSADAESVSRRTDCLVWLASSSPLQLQRCWLSIHLRHI